ncbi:MAG: hypothetical protein Q8P41_10180 [Pseudomonadota bacterium]|nr:hypothetical protein [Pseudomonadota bacterium]
MPSLSDVLAEPAKRKKVVDDGVSVIEAEVSDKGGLSGMAIKTAFAMVQKVKPGFVGGTLNHLLDDFAKKIDPFWLDCLAQKADPRSYFVKNGTQVADALLSITDGRARNASGPIRNTYDKLRPQAQKHVVEAMPRLAGLLQKHAS